MPLHLPLHLEARRRKASPVFGALTRGAAASLASGSAAPLGAALRASGASVDDLLFAASIHGVGGLLSRLAEGERDALAPEEAAALASARERARARGERLAQDLAHLGVLAERAGLRLVPLKGAYLSSERYRDPSLRPCADIDLLAAGDLCDAWGRLLEKDGYAYLEESLTYKNRAYARPHEKPTGSGYLEDTDNPRPVDLHPRIAERFLGGVVDITDAYTGDLHDGTVAGVPARVPGARALALHLFAHAAPTAVGRGVRLLQIHDLTFLPDDAAVGDALVESLGEAAWGLGALFSRAVPGCLGPRVLAALERAAPPRRRRAAWLARPGLLTGEHESSVLVLAELRLCPSLVARAGRLLRAAPDASYLASAYGAQGPLGYLRALPAYYRDRFR